MVCSEFSSRCSERRVEQRWNYIHIWRQLSCSTERLARSGLIRSSLGFCSIWLKLLRMREMFRKFAHESAQVVGSPWAFLLAVATTVVWAMTGPHFHYSDTWQLVINTGTSVSTFLVVFLIQNTQNRDAKVVQLKLDELIRAVQPARTALVHMEELTDQELDALQNEFQTVRDRANSQLGEIERKKKSKAKNN
jgi:low affinity Fe/Cu permease